MSTSPPTPNVAQIPLPPGMSLQQFQSLQGSLVTVAITSAVAFGVMVGVFYQTTTSKLWRTPHLTPMVISQLGVILVVAASGVIFSYRVFAVWAGRKFIYVAMLACWIAVASQYRIQTVPQPLWVKLPNRTHSGLGPLCNASSVLFDLVILILTISRIGHQRGSRVGYLIYRDSLNYFLFTTVTNIVVLAIQALGPSWALTKAAVLPFSTIITATMGVRVFLNLRLVHQRDPVMPLVPDAIRAEMSDSCQSPAHLCQHTQEYDADLVLTSEGTSGKDPQGPFCYTRTPDDPGGDGVLK
ncbi:hypothetical protein JB92DRAFT_2910215 [Gautieria morchelliformis]|nr:hypothetical protein JB92DRAFT_2910215 [Gautieria morchelliformis]